MMTTLAPSADVLKALNLKGRSFLTVADITGPEIQSLIQLAVALKQEKRDRKPHPYLAGQQVAMYFQQPSTRTRVSFEVGIADLGAHPLMLRQDEIGLGKREAVADIARTLGRMVDGIMIRHLHHADVEELAQYAGVPVINGLTKDHHPCQILADLMTVYEQFGSLAGHKLTFVGDGSNNMARSLMEGCALVGMPVTIAAPASHQPDAATVERCRALASGTAVEVTDDLQAAVAGAHVVYTDVWASMGDEAEAEQRRQIFKAYQVNEPLMAKAASNAIVLHCLPAHRGEEITHDTLERFATVIFDEAENRLHAQKALMAALLTR
ncbi:MAG: ornithine carbamoyltransferase [Candidatus Melainabacteria bacterium]|nr:ornithine carbamoyltransferase [Candidatus Melainabacteria bacterium]